MKTQSRRSVPRLESLEGRQLLSTGTVSRPPATPWIEFQAPPPDMIAALSARIGVVETSVGQLNTRVGNIETHSTGVDARLDALEARVTALEARLDQSATIASLQATVASQATQIATLQDQVAALQYVTRLQPTMNKNFMRLAENLPVEQVFYANPQRFFVAITVQGGSAGGKFAIGANENAASYSFSSSDGYDSLAPGQNETILAFGNSETLSPQGHNFEFTATSELWIAGDPGITATITNYDLA